jgi:aspartate/methionine/tyrosine aminotransferase
MEYLGELTEDERQALFKYKGTELFRIVRKAIAAEYQKVGHRMDNADAHQILVLQGQRQGFNSAFNIMGSLGKDPSVKDE